MLIYLGSEIKRRQKKLRDLFYVLGPDSTVMADHLEELARRGVIRPYPAGGGMTASTSLLVDREATWPEPRVGTLEAIAEGEIDGNARPLHDRDQFR